MASSNIKIRKTLIISFIFVFIILILCFILWSFSENKRAKPKALKIISSEENVALTQSLNQLPKTYESNLLDNFLPNNSEKKDEIDALKQKVHQLENVVFELKNVQKVPVHQLPEEKPAIIPKKEEVSTTPGSGLQSQILLFQAADDTDDNDAGIADKKYKNKSDSQKKNKVTHPDTPYDLLAGTSIPAVLQTKIVSDLSGFIVGIVSKNIFDSVHGKFLIIPKGTRLIGAYSTNINYGEKSIAIGFNRLIRPDGSSIMLEKFPAISALGNSGIGESINNHWGSVIGASLLSSVLSIPALMASSYTPNTQNSDCYYDQSNNYICNNNNTNNNSGGGILRNSFLSTASQASSQIGNLIVQRSMSAKPTVIVNPGYSFNVLVTKDLTLPPFSNT